MSTPRQRILEITSDLFHRQGYNRTGVNQIITEAKVAKASFYGHFQSKENLCAVYLEERHDYWFAALREFIDTAADGRERILGAFDFLIFMNGKENFSGCSFLNIISEISPEQTRLAKIVRSHKTDLRRFFAAEIADELMAVQVYLLFESAIIESRVFRSNELIEKAKQIVKNII